MTVAVIGGGASGLMAALTAAEHNKQVYLLERQPRVGRKLLATGNGRCNLSHLALGVENYHGAEPDFVAPALADFGVEQAREFFRNLGLLTFCDAAGRVYPCSEQAGSVVDVLRLTAAERGVVLRTDCEITAVRRKQNTFVLSSSQENFTADQVIVCCGGKAGGKLGGGSGGYRLLQSLGHSCSELYPALVQLKTENSFVRSLKGVRAEAMVRLCRGQQVIAAAEGEVQFTEYGVSGLVIFELSRLAALGGSGMVLVLDLLPAVSEEELTELLCQRAAAWPGQQLDELLTGMLHNRLGRTLIRYAALSLNQPLVQLEPYQCRRIANAVKNFALPLRGTLGFDNAQVTAGGINTAEFKPQTLESKLVPGLYAAGEVLDIDGDCGGYNLHWAWASGRLAGRLL